MKSDQELYRRLRDLPLDTLWREEVPKFDAAAPRERIGGVALIRAVGVAAARGTPEQKAAVKDWLVRLLRDPAEKVRRYAMAALPKLRMGAVAEEPLVELLQSRPGERERRHLGRALGRIGGKATLAAVAADPGLLPQAEQKVRAAVARAERPSIILADRRLPRLHHLRLHLRCRQGLEEILRDEIEEYIRRCGGLEILETRGRYVAVEPTAPFSLADLYRMRCFATVGFALGILRGPPADDLGEPLARLIASPLARRIMSALTAGALRYRLEFTSRSHQRGAVQRLADRVYALCPDLLNDASMAPWFMDIHETPRGTFVELRPRMIPDPRWYYRRDDVPAASHPPLAAAMARLAGREEGDVVWDPFCGSGLELVERSLRGGVRRVCGTDLSPQAVEIARANVAAARLDDVAADFACCDFREVERGLGLGRGSVSLVITNPPMGRRVRIPDMRGLVSDIFDAAAHVLRPGGRLVLVNPIRLEPRDPGLCLEYRKAVDLGGFSGLREKSRTGAPHGALRGAPRREGRKHNGRPAEGAAVATVARSRSTARSGARPGWPSSR